VETAPNPDLDRRAELLAQIGDLLNHLTEPEVVELGSLVAALQRRHPQCSREQVQPTEEEHR
jgi:hypothetical protein